MSEFLTKMTIKNDDTTVYFKDLTTVDGILRYLKSGDEPLFSFRILVLNDDEKIAEYEIDYEYPFGSAKFYQFVSRFLIKPDFRKQYLKTGNWDDIIEYQTPSGYRINPICLNGINMINKMSKKKLKFKHFMNLKTGGVDGFSRLKLEKLKGIIPSSIVDTILQENMDEGMTLSCLRWIARGLKPQRAIRKVKTDAEIRNNIQRF